MSPANSREKLPPRVTDLHTEARRRHRKLIIFFGVFFLLLFSVAFWWVVIYSDLMRFQKFEVTGNTRMTDEEVVGLLQEKVISPSFFGSLFGPVHFLAWPKKMNSEQTRLVPNIRNVSFSRDLWNRRLGIVVEEYQFFGTLCARKRELPQCVWFDKDGFFFEDAFFPEGILVLRVDDYSREKVQLGDSLYPTEKLANALSVFAVVHDLGLPVYGWAIQDSAPDSIEVKVVDGPTLYFGLKFGSGYTTQVIQSLIGEKGIGNIQYIDFRVEGRVYYKDGSSAN